ncbi:MAG: T9SS type A sorting domain-containing protein [Chitinophagales bacterium]|nr:T9SS type A sorting domain-containing protein [Chitinophagales bacterium]
MRKFTLLLATVFFAVAAFAQRPVSEIQLAPRDKNFKWIKAPKPLPVSDDAYVSDKSPSQSISLREAETIIGSTKYDLQTNRAMSERLVRNADGTLSAAWTTLCTGQSSGTYRGSGYNYYNGTSWLTADCNKIEPNSRTGFTNIGVTGSGKEFVLGHSSTVGGMLFTARDTKGSGDWTEYPGAIALNGDDTWAKTAVGGTDGNTIHAIWNASGVGTNVYCDQVGAVVYSRSTDGGATWPVVHSCVDLIGADYYLGFSADDYCITAQGNNVAILVADWTTDLILLKSTDNGDTWTKTIIWQFPIPFYDETTMVIDTDADGTADIIPVPSGDGRVVFDNSGMMHVVFSETFITDDVEADGVGYYPDADGGLWYWNESMGSNAPVLIAAAEDLNGDGELNYPAGPGDGTYYGSGTYGGGLTLKPSIGFDEANRIYVSYATYDELADTTAYGCGHRHTYVIASYDGGESWSLPYDVVPSIEEGGDGENQEAVFGFMARTVDDYVHLIYQRDPAPGTSLSNLTTEAGWNSAASDIVYVKVQLGELTGINNIKPDLFTVSQNTPNPFSVQTQFNIALTKASNVTLRITNILGQEVYSENINYSAGNHVYNFTKGGLSSGIYNFTVMAEGQQVTKKITVD